MRLNEASSPRTRTEYPRFAKSGTYTRKWRAISAKFNRHENEDAATPWTSTSGGPLPPAKYRIRAPTTSAQSSSAPEKTGLKQVLLHGEFLREIRGMPHLSRRQATLFQQLTSKFLYRLCRFCLGSPQSADSPFFWCSGCDAGGPIRYRGWY